MKKTLLLSLATLCIGCGSTLPVCDEALKTRINSRNAQGEQKALLESKALGLEEACAQENARAFENLKDANQRNRR
jgi:hypothetical protein